MAKLVGQDGAGWTTVDQVEQGSNANAFYFAGGGYFGIAGTADTAWIQVGSVGTGATNCKICLYESVSKNRIVVSPAISVTTPGLKSVAITSTPISGLAYELVVVTDILTMSVIHNSGSSNFVNAQNTAANFPYATPPATLPAADLTANGHEFIVYLTGTVTDQPMGQCTYTLP